MPALSLLSSHPPPTPKKQKHKNKKSEEKKQKKKQNRNYPLIINREITKLIPGQHLE